MAERTAIARSARRPTWDETSQTLLGIPRLSVALSPYPKIPFTLARVRSARAKIRRALWYLARARDVSRPVIMTFPERSRTHHSQSLRFGLIATSKGACASIRNGGPGNMDTFEGMATARIQAAAGGLGTGACELEPQSKGRERPWLAAPKWRFPPSRDH